MNHLCELAGVEKVVEYFWEQLADKSFMRWVAPISPSKILLLGRLGGLAKATETRQSILKHVISDMEDLEPEIAHTCREAYQQIGLVFPTVTNQ